MYVERLESLFCNVDDIVTYIIVTCNEKAAIRVDQRVTHQKHLHATVGLVFEIGGLNVVTST